MYYLIYNTNKLRSMLGPTYSRHWLSLHTVVPAYVNDYLNCSNIIILSTILSIFSAIACCLVMDDSLPYVMYHY